MIDQTVLLTNIVPNLTILDMTTNHVINEQESSLNLFQTARNDDHRSCSSVNKGKKMSPSKLHL